MPARSLGACERWGGVFALAQRLRAGDVTHLRRLFAPSAAAAPTACCASRAACIAFSGYDSSARARPPAYLGTDALASQVPATEKMGRVHTSTATVAVMPVPQENEVVINNSDLKIDT